MPKIRFLECGKIINTHGVLGKLRVVSYCDSPQVLASLSTVYLADREGYRPLRVLEAGVHKQFVLLSLEGVPDMDAALRLKGRTLYAAREDIPLPPGRVLAAELIGLPVLDADTGRLYGHLQDLQSAPASDLYEILTPQGRRVLFPAVPAFLDRADPEDGIYIRPIPGFFEEFEEEESITQNSPAADDAGQEKESRCAL